MEILLADDDDSTRELVRRTLLTEGHNVIDVSDGTAAADELRSGARRFDLLIADVDMPGLDGISVAKQARVVSTNIAVILISAHEAQLGRASEIAGPKVETLSKPFPLDSLRAAVTKVGG